MTDPINLPVPADKIVVDFIGELSGIEPEFVEGIYLTGSLTMNDFYANKSDIDFLVLCKKLPDLKTTRQLRLIHKTIEKRYSRPDLSGTYLAFDSLRSDKPEEIKNLTYHQGQIRYGTFAMAPVVLLELKTNSFTMSGQNAETLPIDINRNHLDNFLYKNINSYWTNWINKHSSYFSRKLLLLFFPRLTEWSILGVARQLCSLQTGKIVSKTEAGNYCLQRLPEKYHPILKEAIDIRKDKRSYPLVKSYAINPSLKRLRQTIDCVRYIITAFNKTYHDSRHNQDAGKLTPPETFAK